jgi:multidrug efflux system membrane fusion protein
MYGYIAEFNSALHRMAPQLQRRFGRKRLHIGVAATALVLGGLFLFRGFANREAPPPPPPPQAVVATKVITRDVPLYLDEIGNCTAYATVQVQAQVSGQIAARHFIDGAELKKGDLLFSIDPRPFQAVLGQAQAALAQARSQQQLDETNLKRSQDLFSKGAIDQQDLDVAVTTVKNDVGKTQGAEAAVAAAQLNLDYCQIVSPIDGRAGERLVDVGNIVAGGNGGVGAVLLTIESLDPIYTDFAVAESDLAKVRPYLGKTNLKVQTQAPGDPAASRLGDLTFVDNTVQPGAGTVKMRATTPNPDRVFWPMEFVRVRMILDTLKDAKLVPAEAVQISQRGPYVFVVAPDNSVAIRLVRPGQPEDGGMVVIQDNLQPEETVVVSGQLALAPGVKVAPQPYQNPSQPQPSGSPGMVAKD